MFAQGRGTVEPAAKKLWRPLANRLKELQAKPLRSSDEEKELQELRATQKRKRQAVDVNSAEFLQSYEWRRVRYQALQKHGGACQCCGRGAKDGLRLHVDHIKPRRKFPELALDVNNLQVLCEECNHGKGNWDMTDWRSA